MYAITRRSLLASAGASLVRGAGDAIDLGARRELFVDGFLVDRMRDAAPRLHTPRPAGSALVFDRPWEGVTSAIVTVFADSGRFRMYYRGSTNEDYVIASLLKPGEKAVADHPQVTCYAESKDGIRWTRPDLGLVEFAGSKKNNILFQNVFSDTFAPFRDANPAAPAEERYKGVATRAVGTRKYALFGLVSADGLRWKQMQQEPILTDGFFDTQNLVFWDTVRGRYFAFYRDFKDRIRSFKIATSDDFRHWTPGVWADFGDTPAEQIYTIAAQPYFRAPHILLAFPRRFVLGRRFPEDSKIEGVSDVVFLSSRDGFHWNRGFLEAMLRPGIEERNWTHRSNAPGAGLLDTGPNEVSMYVSRHISAPTHFLERFTFRKDGFASVYAGYRGGEMVTKPFRFQGSRLYLNYATSAVGHVRVELRDQQDRAIPGFTLADCPEMYGDRIEQAVPWKASLAALAGRVVRLRVSLRDADLFALEFR